EGSQAAFSREQAAISSKGILHTGRSKHVLGFHSVWEVLMKKLIIAIDGPVGSGKSTLARRVAQMMSYVYVDTGAMYRALALKASRQGIALAASDPAGGPKEDELLKLARETRIDLRAQNGGQQVFLDGEEVTAAIRTPEISQSASRVAMDAGVRKVLVAEQRRAGERGGVVMEGRDIG